jgi:hypothetical protein
MPYKASDFFVDVVAFFAVVLPGGLLAFLVLTRLQQFGELKSVPGFLTGVAGWLAFFAAAFLLGQALYAAGSWFLDHFYNRTYRLYKNKIKGDPGEPVRAIIKQQFPEPPRPTATPWARAYIGVRNAAAAAAIDELDADSKFFRSLTVALVIAPYVFLQHPLRNAVGIGAIGCILALAMGSTLLQWADILDSRQKGDRVASRPSKLLNVAAAVYGLAFLALLAGAAVVIPPPLMPWVALAYWITTVCSFLRFSQLRWQRNETAYEFFLSLYQLEMKATTVVTTKRDSSVETTRKNEPGPAEP